MGHPIYNFVPQPTSAVSQVPLPVPMARSSAHCSASGLVPAAGQFPGQGPARACARPCMWPANSGTPSFCFR